MAAYETIPTRIEAIRWHGWTGDPWDPEVVEFFHGKPHSGPGPVQPGSSPYIMLQEPQVGATPRAELKVATGWRVLPDGNYVIKGPGTTEPTFSTRDPDSFEAKYRPVA